MHFGPPLHLSSVAGCLGFVIVYELWCVLNICSLIGERLNVVQLGTSLPLFSFFSPFIIMVSLGFIA